jgi:hypothetical protein
MATVTKQQVLHTAGGIHREKRGRDGATAQEVAKKLDADETDVAIAIREAVDEGWLEPNERYPVFFLPTAEGQMIIDSALYS